MSILSVDTLSTLSTMYCLTDNQKRQINTSIIYDLKLLNIWLWTNKI